MPGGEGRVTGRHRIREYVGIPDSGRQDCCDTGCRCGHLGRRRRRRVPSLVVRGTAGVGAGLIVAVLMMSALTTGSPLSGGSLPTDTRHRSGECANHEDEQNGGHRLHSSMMC
jgi:hypothetical protein